jgi:hypothetical protein
MNGSRVGGRVATACLVAVAFSAGCERLREVTMLHVPDVRATASWYEGIGFAVLGTHEEDGFMDWAAFPTAPPRSCSARAAAPAHHRREVDLYVFTDDVEST